MRLEQDSRTRHFDFQNIKARNIAYRTINSTHLQRIFKFEVLFKLL